ncbi:MAG: hypothetical protein IJ242_13085 [Clostridia bacterium]|nr:hypothetical protein [Clostridia bacterium]
MKHYTLKLLILLVTIYDTALMAHWVIGFTFFTQLSNLFAAAVTALQLIYRNDIRRSQALKPVKYQASVSILVTFLVYLFVLAPMMPGGILAAYAQDHYASLCLHVITPLLTVTDFLVNDWAYPWKRRHILYAAIPPVIYLFFILLLGRLGLRWGGNLPAPYFFLNYEAAAGWFGILPETAGYTSTGIGVFYIILIFLAFIMAIGALLLYLATRFSGKKTQ